MAEHIWTVLCYKGLVDTESNQVSLLDVVEEINLEETPTEDDIKKGAAIAVNLNLVTYWIRSEAEIKEDAQCIIMLKGPSGKEYPPINININLKESFGHRHFVKLTRLPYDGLGYYWFVIMKPKTDEADFEQVAAIPFKLQSIPQE